MAKIKTLTNLRGLFLMLTLVGLGMQACSEDDSTLDCFPIGQVDLNLNLNLPQFNALNNANGWVYASGIGAGTRGLILVNTGTQIRAFDRNAPHVCPSDNTTLIVEGDIKIVLPADGAEWNLLTGEPLNDITGGRSPRSYPTQRQGSTLRITN